MLEKEDILTCPMQYIFLGDFSIYKMSGEV